jgi:hypothetical protein
MILEPVKGTKIEVKPVKGTKIEVKHFLISGAKRLRWLNLVTPLQMEYHGSSPSGHKLDSENE